MEIEKVDHHICTCTHREKKSPPNKDNTENPGTIIYRLN